MKYKEEIIIILVGLVIMFLGLFGFVSCTAQYRAKNYGGTYTIELPANQEFVNITWKEDHIWYLTKPMDPNHEPTVYTFKESSSIGVLNGTVVIKESKK